MNLHIGFHVKKHEQRMGAIEVELIEFHLAAEDLFDILDRHGLSEYVAEKTVSDFEDAIDATEQETIVVLADTTGTSTENQSYLILSQDRDSLVQTLVKLDRFDGGSNE